jgi:S-adenosylmethionine hydrolase
MQENGAWRGEVIHIDHFGNAATNILADNLGSAVLQQEAIRVRVRDVEIQGMVNTFGERKEGQVVALLGSTGNLIISLVNGSAAAALGIRVGDPVMALLPNNATN